jgi:hypothetical protein
MIKEKGEDACKQRLKFLGKESLETPEPSEPVAMEPA